MAADGKSKPATAFLPASNIETICAVQKGRVTVADYILTLDFWGECSDM